MMAAFKAKGIKIIVDIVPNHSSDDHVWFQEALKSPKGSNARARYIFRDGQFSPAFRALSKIVEQDISITTVLMLQVSVPTSPSHPQTGSPTLAALHGNLSATGNSTSISLTPPSPISTGNIPRYVFVLSSR
jgi:hypothetical protein